jgi:hypothetical protein
MSCWGCDPYRQVQERLAWVVPGVACRLDRWTAYRMTSLTLEP